MRDLQAIDFVDVRHIRGDRNLSDMFTKENKDDTHYTECRDVTMSYSLLFKTIYTDELVTKVDVQDNIPISRRIVP